MSEDRFGTYLTAAGFNPEKALRLYVWNAQMGEAFHLSIQAVEISLRNRVNVALTETFGSRWWENATLLAAMDDQHRADVAQVLKRIRNRKKPISNGQVVAGLSFGFWLGLLQKRYNPVLWGGRLHKAFPNYPRERNRASLAKVVGQVATLRNRISHHEPIIRLDLSGEHANIMAVLAWMSAAKADWVRGHCRVQAVLRQKP